MLCFAKVSRFSKVGIGMIFILNLSFILCIVIVLKSTCDQLCICNLAEFILQSYIISHLPSGGRVVRWCWVNFQCRGVLLIWIRVGQAPSALAVVAGEGCLDIFLSSIISLFCLPLSGRRPDID